MTILFLCGTVEPGKDGVGDYTRRLAGELINQGHHCAIIALMDKYVESAIEEKQINEGQSIQTFRLPYNSGYLKNIKSSRSWVESIKPDWISLQFVIFTYHKKGLPFSLPFAIKQLIKGYNFHIMFHELWVGLSHDSSIKLKIWGKAQKFIICRLIKLNPLLIHSHTQAYIYNLNKIQNKARYLKVFGAIPIIGSSNENSKTFIFNKDVCNISFVIYGTIHPDAPVESFAKYLSNYLLNNSITAHVFFIGRNGNELSNWLSAFKISNIATTVYGECTVEFISELLLHCNIGITTNPIMYCEKSSTVQSMLDYGLPVISVSSSINFVIKGIVLDNLIGITKFDNDNDFLTLTKSNLNLYYLQNIASKFAADLQYNLTTK